MSRVAMFRSYLVLVTVGIAQVIASELNAEDEIRQRINKAKRADGLSVISALYPLSNIVLSPFSISASLNILRQAASGRTSKEIHHIITTQRICPNSDLSIGDDYEEVNVQKRTKFYHGSRLYLSKKQAPPLPKFEEQLQSQLHVGIKHLDFQQQQKVIATDLDNWVRRVTHGRLGKLYESSFFRNASMVLFDFAFFESNWDQAFEKDQNDMEFHNVDGTISGVSSMSVTGDFLVAELHDIEATAIVLPFGTGNMAMIIVVANRGADPNGDIERFQQELCHFTAQDLLKRMRLAETRVRMPEFELKQTINLKDVFEYERYQAITGHRSNYRKINGRNDAHLSSLIHEACITVDPYGVRAKSTDAFGVQNNNKVVDYQLVGHFEEPVEFEVIIDRPFAFYIYDGQTNYVPLLGRVIKM